MKTFVTVKSSGYKEPKINTKVFNESEGLLKLIHLNHDNVRYTIVRGK